MTTFERRQRLVRFLEERSGIKVTELAERLNVSQGTIRNDLRALEQAGQIARVRGGAVVRNDHQFATPSFAARVQVHAESKARIASRAVEMIEDGDSIILDASTTVFALIPYLQRLHNLTIVTNGIEAGLALAKNTSHTVILVGGVLRSDGTSVVGHLGVKTLDDLHIKTAFVSCSGFTLQAGLTEIDIQEVLLKRKMIGCAERVIALIDSHKFGRVDLTSFAGLEQISHIFTDSDVDPEFVEQLRPTCTTLTVCGDGTVTSFDPCGQDATLLAPEPSGTAEEAK
jgi:DeoR/GlpR family transcriptional regulator of sugar metabolism